MVTLDTNAIIYYLAGDRQAGETIETLLDSDTTLFVSGVTETELLSYPSLEKADLKHIDAVLSLCTIVHTNTSITRLAGALRRTYKTPIIDALIAATALYTGSTLLTRNEKDFKRISELQWSTI